MQARYLIGGALLFGAFAAISVATFYDEKSVYLTVDEFLTESEIIMTEGARYQIRGQIDDSSVERLADGLELRFDITGQDGRIQVLYRGLVPDTFDLADEVTVAGSLGSDGTLTADNLSVQCPSKYEAAPGEVLDDPGSSAAVDRES